MTSVRNGCYDVIGCQKSLVGEEVLENRVGEGLRDWDLREVIERCIAQLPKSQREVVHLKDVEGYETEQIAEIMDIKSNMVRALLSQARATLIESITKMMNYGVQ